MFKIIKFALKLFITTQPVFFFFILIIGIPHGLLHSVATLVFSHWFFDTISEIITGGEPLGKAYLVIIIAGSVFIIREIMECVYNFLFGTVLFHKPGRELKKMVHAKMARINPVYFEDPKLHDNIEKADSGAGAILGMVSYIVVLSNVYLPYFIFMSFYLHNLQPHLLWIILFAFVPTLFSQIIKIGITSKFEDKAAPIRREYDYYGQTITDRLYYKETRKLGAYKFFLTRLIDSMRRLSIAEWDRSIKINLIELSTDLVTAGGYAGILYLLVTALLSGDITAGAFAAVLASISKMFGWMSDIIDEGAEDIIEGVSKARNFMRFIELPERGGIDTAPDFSKGITAENISFVYPNFRVKRKYVNQRDYLSRVV